MEQFFEVLMFLFGKFVVFLPFAFVVRYITERALGFNAKYWSVFSALLIGNLAAALTVTGLYKTGFLAPHGNVRAIIFQQLAIRYLVLFLFGTGFIILLFRDQEGSRIPLLKGLVIGLALLTLSVSVTAFYWITAV